MTPGTGSDAARRSARRAVIRRFHPDAGGDAADLDAALRAGAVVPVFAVATRRGRFRRHRHLMMRQYRRFRITRTRRTFR